MGIVTDANSKPIVYNEEAKSYTIREGIFIAKNRKVYDVCRNRVQSALGKTIGELQKEVLKIADE